MVKNFVYGLNFLMAFFSLVSCNDEGAINNILGIYSEAPLYTGYKVVSGNQIDFNFSTEVFVKYAVLSPEAQIESVLDGSCVSVFLAQEYLGGEKFTADILVEDKDGNTLNILVPFRAFNNRVPAFVINEIRLNGTKPASEFIELKTLSAGNMAAVKLYIVSFDPEESAYEFPPAEVAAGEYIILHLRTRETDTAVDELGSELNLAASGKKGEAPEDARDLWLSGNVKTVHDTDVIYFTDQSDNIIDGIVLCEKTNANWLKNENFKKAAELLARQKQWFSKDGTAVKSPADSDAVPTEGNTQTRTLCRDETVDDSSTSNDWYICYTGCSTPGKQNNPKRWTPK